MAQDQAAAPGPEQPAVDAPAAARRPRGPRGPRTVGDMVRSLGLVLGAVVVVLLITLRPGGQAIRVVDYQGVLDAARVGAAFPLVDPVGLPRDWQATSAYFDPPGEAGAAGVTSWHVGFVTADSTYAAFEQTNGIGFGTLQDVLGDPVQEHATSTVGGLAWDRWSSSAGDRRALVRTENGVTVVVDGSASWSDLERLAASLHPTPVIRLSATPTTS